MGAGLFGRGDDLLPAGVRLAVGDVLGHGAGFQPGLLQYHAKVGPQRIPRQFVDGQAAHPDLPAVDLVKAHQQVDQRGLAAAGGAHQGDALAGLCLQAQVLEQRCLRRVAKAHMVKLDAAVFGRGGVQRPGVGGVGADGRLVDQVKHPLGAGQGVLQLGHHAGNVVEGLGVLVGVVEEGRQPAHRDGAADGQKRPDDRHRRIDQRVDKAGGGVGQGGEEHRPHTAFLQVQIDALEPLFGAGFVAEGPHQVLVAHQLLHQRGHLGAGLALHLEHRVGALGDEPRHKNGQRRQDHHHQRDAPVDGQHKDQGAQYGQHAGEQLGKAHQQTVRKLLHVGGDAADGVAGAVAVNVGQRQHLHVVKGLHPDVPHHLVGDAVVAQAHGPLGQGGHGDGHGQPHPDAGQRGKIHLAGAQDLVHRVAGQDGGVQGGGHRHGSQRQHQDDPGAVGGDQCQHPPDGGRVGAFGLFAHTVRDTSSLESWLRQISR